MSTKLEHHQLLELCIYTFERLEKNDGVVVQGPPGTGKTHTIANIICHYLTTGRSVLVTSKAEQALTVLQDQIPPELKELTICLLTNEKAGFKQIEGAIQLLAGLVSRTNLRDLNQKAETYNQRTKKIEKDIQKIDAEVAEWGLKQLEPVKESLADSEQIKTAMEMAKQVVMERSKHSWLSDKLKPSPDFDPQFNDSNVAKIREIRQVLREDIIYVEKKIPTPQDIIDTAQIIAVHDDLVIASQLTENAQNLNVAPLAVSALDSLNRAKNLLGPLSEMQNLLKIMERSSWLREIFNSWLDSKNDTGNVGLFEELLKSFDELIERRQFFVKTPVEVADPLTQVQQDFSKTWLKFNKTSLLRFITH